MNRKNFIKTLSTGTIAASCLPLGFSCSRGSVPSYLRDYSDLYYTDPHAASLAWFRDARFGLFLHYGLYSILGRGEWVMYHEAIPVKEYEKLKMDFKAGSFDADFITDLALEAGMKYVNITARHHDSFCLFPSRYSDYNSMNSPAKRDLVGELAEQCQKKSLGFFLYYSYALDWRHPYFYPREFWRYARPDYQQPEPSYLWKNDDDFAYYLEFVHNQIRELLTNYGPLAGIWFDPITGYLARPDLFPIHDTYSMIRKLQPQTLICFKQGATGTEDFAAPERIGESLADRIRRQFDDEKAQIAHEAWEANKVKRGEICDTLQPRVWGYRKQDAGLHIDANETLRRLGLAFGQNCNLLMNTGPLPDGSINPVDVNTLREVGRTIKTEGWPEPLSLDAPDGHQNDQTLQ